MVQKGGASNQNVRDDECQILWCDVECKIKLPLRLAVKSAGSPGGKQQKTRSAVCSYSYGSQLWCWSHRNHTSKRTENWQLNRRIHGGPLQCECECESVCVSVNVCVGLCKLMCPASCIRPTCGWLGNEPNSKGSVDIIAITPGPWGLN